MIIFDFVAVVCAQLLTLEVGRAESISSIISFLAFCFLSLSPGSCLSHSFNPCAMLPTIGRFDRPKHKQDVSVLGYPKVTLPHRYRTVHVAIFIQRCYRRGDERLDHLSRSAHSATRALLAQWYLLNVAVAKSANLQVVKGHSSLPQRDASGGTPLGNMAAAAVD